MTRTPATVGKYEAPHRRSFMAPSPSSKHSEWESIGKVARRALFVLALILGTPGCAAVMAKVTSGVADNLSVAILNQNDPETVRDGLPAYLLMLDSFVEGNPDSVTTLSAASELYAAYGTTFVDDPERARRLTLRSFEYGQRTLCLSHEEGCGLATAPALELSERLEVFSENEVEALYSLGLSWLAFIQSHAAEPSALSDLPRATAVVERVRELDPGYKASNVELYLAILKTIRPPALGGDFAAGRAHFDRAWALSGERDLNVRVKFARYIPRALYDRETHDAILRDVLASETEAPGLTLSNTLAQREARALLQSGKDLF